MRSLQVVKALFIAAAVGFLAGVAALLVCLGPSDWTDLTGGLLWYLAGRLPLAVLLPLALLTLAVSVALWRVVSSSHRAVRQQPAPKTRGGVSRGHELQREELVARARRALDLELKRSKPQLEQVVDAILGLPVDLGVTGLSLEPAGESAEVEVALTLGDLRLPVTSLQRPLYEQVLQELRQMARLGPAGEGVVKLQSNRRLDRLRVALTHQPAGIAAHIEVLGESVSEARVVQQDGRRRSNSVVFRLEPALRSLRTGELQVMPIEENDATDPGTGLAPGRDPAVEHELASLAGAAPTRQVGRLEASLRLTLASALTVLVVFFFWNAYAWALATIFTDSGTPWRAVTLRIASSPVAGEVNVAGRRLGRTPLDARVSCRGQSIRILVQARGYSTWQWSGICPEQGALELLARLKLRR